MKSNYRKGSSTIEILIAFALLVLTMSAVITVAFGNQSLSVDTQIDSEALYKAQALLEQVRATSRQDFTLVASQASVAEQSGPISYTKKLDVTDIDSYTKQATSTVSWQSGGRTLSIVLSTLLTNSQAAAGNQCSPTITGDWTAPQIYGYIDFPSPKGGSGVSVKGGKAYVSSDPNSKSTDDFYVVDVSGAGPGVTALPILGQLNTTYGLTDVRAAGKYVYVTADSAVNQLLVIDVSSANPSIAKSIDLTVSGDTAFGNTLAYSSKDKKLYVGLTLTSKPADKEFHEFCVGPDPSFPTCAAASLSNPVELGTGYKVGDTVNHITIGKNNVVYLTTTGNNQIIALDLTTPSSPSLIGSYPATTPPYGQALALDSTAGKLYFGQTDINNPQLMAFSTSNLTTSLWTLPMNKGVFSMILRSNLLFMTTGDSNDGLQIWDVSGAPSRFDTSPLNIQQGASAGTDCFGNLLYVAQRSNRAMQVMGPLTPFGYALNPNDQNISVVQGSSGTDVVQASLISGISQNVTFSASIPPSATGVTTSFSPNKCTPNCSTTITVNTSASTPPGTYMITVTGSGGVTTTFMLTIPPIVPSFSTNPNPTSGTIGVSLKDSASLSGGFNPTGNITFKLYDPNDASCSASPVFTSMVTVNGNGTYNTPTGFTSNIAGTWHWSASYTGDSNNSSASSPCSAEPVTVNKISQTITVTTHAPASATYNSTFSVAASASSGLGVTITTTGVCSITGSTVTMTSGTGTCTVHYNQSGNGTYSPAPEVTDTTTATKQSPTISTTIFNAANNQAVTTIAIGGSVYDKATLGNLGPIAPTGTVTFNFYVNKNGCPNGSPTTNTAPVNGSGVAQSAATGALAATSNGKFDFYQATYNPGSDPNYASVTAPTCEPLTVN